MGKRRDIKLSAKQMKRLEKFSNKPIGQKLKISHGIIIGGSIFLSILFVIAMMYILMFVQNMYDGPVTNATYIADFRYALADIPNAVNYIRAEGVENINESMAVAEKDINNDWNLMNTAHDVLKNSLTSETSKAHLEEIYQDIKDSQEELTTVMQLLQEGNMELAGVYFDTNLAPLLDSISADVDSLNAEIAAEAYGYLKNAQMSGNIQVLVGIVLLVIISVTGISIMTIIVGMITTPVAELKNAAAQMSEGNMSAYKDIQYKAEDELGLLANDMRGTMYTLSDYISEISEILGVMAQGDLTLSFSQITDFKGDFASIKESFVHILKEFNKTLNEIQEVSLMVDKGAEEIATSANELAAGSEEQASSVEELTATINTVSSMAEESAKQAAVAYRSIQESVRNAEEKRVQVQELQEEMQRIKEISGEIANIITTIEEIADQTSLLSLNASIEAARAGEAGRGFAVVADEIGKLASDSAQAAVNTRVLIEKTVSEIEKGNRITESTAEAFENIIKEMDKFADTSKTTNESAMEQANYLKQVEEGVGQIASVTQNTAASAQESLATSEELAARATELDELVKRFKLFKA